MLLNSTISKELTASLPNRGRTSIASTIALHARTMPQSVAVVEGDTGLSYADLDRRSNQLAAHLLESGAGHESCIGIFMERSADFVIAALAILKSGAAYLPLDPAAPADRTAGILRDSGAELLLTHRRKTREWKPGNWHTIEIDGPESAQISARPSRPVGYEPHSQSLAYVIYTSGSTGIPKGVEITHANLLNLVQWHQSAFNLTSADRASHVAGLGFDAAGWEIWPALTAGATLHVADENTRRSPQALHDWLISEKITVAFVPTVLAEHLLQMKWPEQTALRFLLTGADTLHRRPTADLPFAMVNNYGPTECTVVATSGIVGPSADADGPPSIGRPIGDTTALILDENLRPVAPGSDGELCLAGALVGRGYRNNRELTAAKFIMYSPNSGPRLRMYRTGDRVRLLPNGEIAFLGRVDDQVKIRGYRIELGEIISCIDRYPGIDASAVTVRQDQTAGPTLVAYLVLARDTKLTASDLREFIAARLPEYMIPSQFVKMPALPITANGKLDRASLPAANDNNVLPARMVAAPVANASGIEHKLGALVASLLSRPSVGVQENFFMVGGHSMLGVQLVARIRDVFGVKLTLLQLFNAPTIMALSAEVARLTEKSHA
jgi:amino acid adenylation domain-containing protein